MTTPWRSGWQNYGWANLDYSQRVNPAHGTGGTSDPCGCRCLPGVVSPSRCFRLDALHGSVVLDSRRHCRGQTLQLQATVNGNALPAVAVPAPQANSWQQVTVSLPSLGVQGSMDGFWLQNTTGATLPTFYVDDIALVANPPPANLALQVNAGSVLRQVDARIFGLNTALWDSQLGTAAQPCLARRHRRAIAALSGRQCVG